MDENNLVILNLEMILMDSFDQNNLNQNLESYVIV